MDVRANELTDVTVGTQAPIRIDAVEVRLVRLPLAEPFETSLWRVESRLVFLVRLEAEGMAGWGEVVALERPLYSYDMIEQPLQHDDLLDHAELQKALATDICLDESITGLRRATEALALGGCRIVNMKVGRVGGYSQALPIHDLCRSKGVPLWCGGMLESGIGQAHNIALASLPGFTLPGDISASQRYFVRDIISPEVVLNPDGTLTVPRGAGLGFEVDVAYMQSQTEGVTSGARPRVRRQASIDSYGGSDRDRGATRRGGVPAQPPPPPPHSGHA